MALQPLAPACAFFGVGLPRAGGGDAAVVVPCIFPLILKGGGVNTVRAVHVMWGIQLQLGRRRLRLTRSSLLSQNFTV